MDLIADYANLRGVGREAVLDETIPWMLHCLHRHAAKEARCAITHTHGTHVATAAAFGCEGGLRVLRHFYADQERIVDSTSLSSSTDRVCIAPAEIAFFERITRSAQANLIH